MSDDQGGLPPLDDDGIWSGAEPDEQVAAPRRGPAAPPRRGGVPDPRRGPARPPRRTAPIAGGPVLEDDGHDYVDLPHEGSFPRWLGVLLVLLLLAGVVFGGGYYWYDRQLDPPGSPGEVVSVEIPQGSSTSGIGSILDSKGIIANSMVFNFYASRKGAGPFEAGVYRLKVNSDVDLVLETMAKGPSGPIVSSGSELAKVTIPEGYTVAQILARIHEKVPRLAVADLQAALDGGKVPTSLLPAGQTSYEGLLFPATYEIGGAETAAEVLTKMAEEMETRAEALGISEARAHIKRQWGLELSAYDMLKVASMIQYEAAVPADGPKIGAVTYNRLKAGTPLGYDSTSIYEAGLEGRAADQVDYTADTPYNTRINAGLPPTPIAAPGEYALEGAMEPVDEPWLYFVLTDTKEVTFTVTYDDFLQAKALCQQRNLGCG
ncbi:hypothetical protein BH10ACT1_BH10ACT1_24360 [soil metagenome]